MRRLLAILVLFGWATGVRGEEPTGAAVITVDMVAGTVTPAFPVVNLAAGDSVVVRILPRSAKWRSRVVAAGLGAEDEAFGSDVVINFGQAQTKLVESEAGAKRRTEGDSESHYNAFFVKSGVGTIGLRITLADVKELEKSEPAREEFSKKTGIDAEDLSAILKNTPYTVPIRAERKAFRLQFGAGFGFLDQRDERYGVRPLADGSGVADIVALDKGDWAARLVAFAHYSPVRHEWLALSFGLGTDLPSTGLTAMLGPSVRLSTLPIVDSVYITGGIAYLPRQRLLQSYQTSASVDASVDAKDLTGARYGFGAFVAVTFGFFGGAEDFKSVYAGKRPPQGGN